MQTNRTDITKHFFAILCITDAEGKLLAEYNYGARGRARNPETWALNPAGFENPQGLALLNGRGYTAHEMLSEFGLINMNGRLYDPVLGRMLSPDNYIQAPDYTQNFNRYSYVLNNPLKYTDPDGQWVAQLIGAILGQYIGGVVANGGELNPLQWTWVGKDGWKTWLGMGIGAGLGAIGGYYAAEGGVSLAFNILTPVGAIGVVGQGSNWSFQWTTNAGGGGSVPIGNNNRQNTSAVMQQQINNVSANYRRDKQYEYYMYLQSQYANTSNNTDNYSVQFVSSNSTSYSNRQSPPWRSYFIKNFNLTLNDIEYVDYEQDIVDYFDVRAILTDPEVTPREYQDCRAYPVSYNINGTFHSGNFYGAEGNGTFIMNKETGEPGTEYWFTPIFIGKHKVYFRYCVICDPL